MHFFLLIFKNRLLGSLGGNNVKAVVLFVCLLWYAASGFLFFEMEFKPDLGWSDALWWALVTMSTVGYGDLFPTTLAGRFLVGIPVIVFGIGFLGYIISAVAAALVETRSRRLQGMCAVDFSDHIIIINFTRLDEITALILELRADPLMLNKKICLVDEKLEEIPAALVDRGVHFVKGSPTDIETLERAGIARATHAIILARDRLDYHSDDQNLVTVMVIEKINPKIFTVVEVIDKKKKPQFSLAGADDCVCLGELAISLISREILDPGVNSVIMELTSNLTGSEIYIVPIKTGGNGSYKDLQLKCMDSNVTVIGVSRQGKIVIGCMADMRIDETDKAIVIGADRVKEIVL